MSNILVLSYQQNSITFDELGWFNATTAAEHFNKRPIDWLKLDSTKEYLSVLADLLNCEESSLLKTRRGRYQGGTWLHPRLAVRFSQWLDARFAVWCDLQIESIIKQNHPHYDWKRLRHEASSSFKVMNAVLQLLRQEQGKVTASHHYMNEARLVNWALTGEFKSLNRDDLSSNELDMLAKLEERNAVLMGLGIEYPTRKMALSQFAGSSRGLAVH